MREEWWKFLYSHNFLSFSPRKHSSRRRRILNVNNIHLKFICKMMELEHWAGVHVVVN